MDEAEHSKLIEYLLGHARAEDDAELSRLLTQPDADEKLSALSDTLAQLASDAPACQPSSALKARILSGISGASENRYQGHLQRLMRFFDLPAKPAQSLLNSVGRLQQAEWARTFVPGAWFQDLIGGAACADMHCGLIHLEPGTQVPAHRHRGNEWMYVIQGGVKTSDGEYLTVGDVLLSRPDTDHSLSADADIGCDFAVKVIDGVDWLQS